MSHLDEFLFKEVNTVKNTASFLLNMSELNYNSLATYITNQNETDFAIEEIGNKLDILDFNVSKAIQDLQAKARNNFYNAFLLTAANSQLNSLSDFNENLESLLQALTLLKKGSLPVSLVSEATLESALNTIATALQSLDRGLAIVKVPILYYYGRRVHMHFVNTTRLLITVPIPIGRGDNIYTIYRTNSFLVPLETSDVTSLGFSTIMDLPAYLAVSTSRDHYLQLSESDFDICTTGRLIECRKPFPRLIPSNPTCILALFLDVSAEVHHICDFRIEMNKPIPLLAYPLATDSFLLVTDVTPSVMSCPMTLNTSFDNIAYSIITIPCSCSITNAQVTMVNSNLSCLNTEGLPSIMMCPVNLPVWQHFGHPPGDVSGITVSQTPFSPDLPDLEGLRQLHLHRGSQLAGEALFLRGKANEIRANIPGDPHPILRYLDYHTSHPIFELLGFIFGTLSLGVSALVLIRGHRAAVVSLLPKYSAAMTRFSSWKKELASNSEKWQELAKLQGGIIDSTHGVVTAFDRYDTFFMLLATFTVLMIIRMLWRGRRLVRCLYTAPNHPQLHLGVKFHFPTGTYLLHMQELPWDRNVLPKQYTNAPVSQDFHLSKPLLRHVVARWDAPLHLTLTTGETTAIQLQERIPCPLGLRIPILVGLRRPYRSTLVIIDGSLHYSLLPKTARTTAPSHLFSLDPAVSGLPAGPTPPSGFNAPFPAASSTPVAGIRGLQPPYRLSTLLARVEEEPSDEAPHQDAASQAF